MKARLYGEDINIQPDRLRILIDGEPCGCGEVIVLEPIAASVTLVLSPDFIDDPHEFCNVSILRFNPAFHLVGTTVDGTCEECGKVCRVTVWEDK